MSPSLLLNMCVCYYSCTIELKICEYKKGVVVSTKTAKYFENNHYSLIANIKKRNCQLRCGQDNLKESTSDWFANVSKFSFA